LRHYGCHAVARGGNLEEVAAFGYLVIAIVAVLRVRGDKVERPEIAEST
jgi:hypothetical protein